MARIEAEFATTGMHCSSCSMLVDMTLKDLEGVSDSRTDHATGRSVVVFEEDAVTADQIIEAVRGVGYEAELVQTR